MASMEGGHIIFKLPAGRIPFHLLDLFDRGIAIERDQGLVQVQVAAFATEQSSRYLLTAIRSKVRPRKYGEAWEERRGAMYWLVGTLHTSEWEGEARQHFYGLLPPFFQLCRNRVIGLGRPQFLCPRGSPRGQRSDERMQDGIDGGVGQKQAARRGWIAAQLAPSSSTAAIIPAPFLQVHFPLRRA